MNPLFDLSGRIALITGSGQGLGFANARGLAQAGAAIALNGRNEQKLAAAAETLRAEEARVTTAAFDVTDAIGAAPAIKRIEAEFGPIDILVNNAGVIRDGLFIQMSPEHWDEVMRTNLGGAFNFCQAVVYDHMLKRRTGRIINVSSVAATHVNPGQTNYAASKGAINSFTRALAVECAKRGVTVNAIAPGFIETEMTSDLDEGQRGFYASVIPAGRMGHPEEIASAVEYLASPDAAYVTGHVLHVYGGLYM